ncbi:MAG: alpha/beta hydrolase [Thermodesulfobacteriota bacterium]
MAFLVVNGLRIYYEVHGQGDPVLLLHNGFSCAKMWADIYPGLVENGYLAVMYDRRGYGRSERGPEFESHYLGDRFRRAAVEELTALVEQLGLATVDIVGQCEGGVLAFDYALKHPERVGSIITASTLCFSRETMTEFNARKFPKSFIELPREVREKYIYWHGEDYAESFYLLCSRYGGEYGRDVFDLRPVLPAIRCPVLVLYPDRSYFFEVEQAVAFYRGLPEAELAVLPRCGHNIHEHYPGEYVRQVLSFLKRRRQGRPGRPRAEVL